jgi:predicted RNase H-like HicB family nuclease
MFTLAYPAVFKQDAEGRLVVSFPDFPAAQTDGADANEAMEEAIDCLGSVIAFAMADKVEVPRPSPLKRGQKVVPIRDMGISQSELARRLNVRETIVRRMLDPNSGTRTEKIQAALEVLGKRVVAAYDDAA